MEILYQDHRILVCLKPPGVLSTDEPGGLPGLLRQQLGDEKACVRTVHRLDRMVGGVMVLARSREASRILSEQIRIRQFHKEYLAVVHGTPAPAEGTFCDLLLRCKEERKTYIVSATGKDVQEAVLDYETLERRNGLSLVRIQLKTGRTHQIRAQFSSHGYPLVGDRKYGAAGDGNCGVALWSCCVSFRHPQTAEPMTFCAPPPQEFPWNRFTSLDRMKTEIGVST